MSEAKSYYNRMIELKLAWLYSLGHALAMQTREKNNNAYIAVILWERILSWIGQLVLSWARDPRCDCFRPRMDRNFYLGTIARGVWKAEVPQWSPGAKSPEAEAVSRHYLQIFTHEKMKNWTFRTIHILVPDQYVSRGAKRHFWGLNPLAHAWRHQADGVRIQLRRAPQALVYQRLKLCLCDCR